MNPIEPWYKPILDWLAKVVPGLIGAATLGYNVGRREKKEVENKLHKSELEREKLKNEIDVQKDFDGKSDSDVIHDAARKGGRRP